MNDARKIKAVIRDDDRKEIKMRSRGWREKQTRGTDDEPLKNNRIEAGKQKQTMMNS